jgi:Putative restriction endonuclease
MATQHPTDTPVKSEAIPPLENGDRLTRDEFERRYDAMPHLRKAELIEGVVSMPSPVRHDRHGRQHFRLIAWLGAYEAVTPGVEGSDNATARLDVINEPQPDALLIIHPDCGGQACISADGYVEQAPEFVAETSASSVSIDLNAKFEAYRRCGVREYVVWRIQDRAIDWFVLRGEEYQRLEAGPDGIHRSETFPGLWLDAQALAREDVARVMEVVRQGTGSEDQAAFVKRLAEARGAK